MPEKRTTSIARKYQEKSGSTREVPGKYQQIPGNIRKYPEQAEITGAPFDEEI